MERKTLVHALSVLDVQRKYMNEGSPESIARQVAYYDGMLRMLETIVSNAYEDNVFVIVDDGKHSILS